MDRQLIFKGMMVFMAMLTTLTLMAQPVPPPATPIDGGLGLLLVGGAAYGLKKLKDMKK